jgi:aspartate carbamoyltransferase regulatory subunit
MHIDSIINGIVIDHIAAGRGMKLYQLLKLDTLDCSIALIKNAHSTKMGKKDIIKIDGNIDVNMDVLGYVDPNATVAIIREGKIVEKRKKTSICKALHLHSGRWKIRVLSTGIFKKEVFNTPSP